MKINYIGHLDPFKFSGGGEMVLGRLLRWGEVHRGHKISLNTANPKFRSFDPRADLIFMADLFNNPLGFKKIKEGWINELLHSWNYIHFDNSYVDACNLDYLPCSGRPNEQCQYKSFKNFASNLRRREFSRQCFQGNPLVKKIYHKSLLNVFVSPLHKQVLSNMLGLENTKNFILRPLIDTKKFTNMGLDRDIDYLFVGIAGEAKGLENLRQMFAGNDKKLTIIGRRDGNEDLGFAEYLGYKPYDELPTYFNRAKNFVYLPRWPEPQGRVVVEAALCGCNLITNENIGALSFGFEISDPNNFMNVEAEFWDHLESLVN